MEGGHCDIGNDEFRTERGEVGEEEVEVVLAEEVFFGEKGVDLDVFGDLFVFPGAEVVNDEEIVDDGDEEGGEKEIHVPSHVSSGDFTGSDVGERGFEGEEVVFRGGHFKK